LSGLADGIALNDLHHFYNKPPGDLRRWTNGGRKVEPTDQFGPPRWRSIGMRNFTLAPPSLRSVATSFGFTDAGDAADKRRTEGGHTERFRPPRWGLIRYEHS
jgi:hypothetical protein